MVLRLWTLGEYGFRAKKLILQILIVLGKRHAPTKSKYFDKGVLFVG